MAKTQPSAIPEKAIPVLSDDDLVRRLLADCSGKDFHDRRDLAIIRLFLNTGMRLEGMAGLRYIADDPQRLMWTCGRGSPESWPKDGASWCCPSGPRRPGTLIDTSGVRGHSHAADSWLWLGKKGRLTASRIGG
jgi:site-specific recombinase XerC